MRDKNEITEVNTFEGYDNNGIPIFSVIYIK